MKMKYMAIAAAALIMSACGSSEKAEAETTDSTEPIEQTEAQATDNETVTSEATTATANVIEIEADEALRPGKALPEVTIVDFNATWCVPCKKFAPVFDEAAGKYADVTFLSVDIDKNPNTARAFNVNVVPTVVILGKDGKELKRYEGTGDLLPADTFFSIVESVK